jgi:myo-inositol-1(or 4)-monophosphatase
MDKVMEDLIVRQLEEIGDVRLISEERGTLEIGSPRMTVVADPLDGSFNAKMGISLFAMSLALVQGEPNLGNVVLGYVRNLVNGDEYYAMKGEGAFQNRAPISTSSRDEIKVLGMEPHPNTVIALEQQRALVDYDTRLRSLGCMALDLCYVANGIFDAMADVRGGLSRVLDMSAGKIIIEEAGGMVTDEKGRSLDQVSVDVSTRIDFIAAGNKDILEKIVRVAGR